MSPTRREPFSDRLAKAHRILVRELRDGRCDCRRVKGLCREHWIDACEAELSPRKNKHLQQILGTKEKAS